MTVARNAMFKLRILMIDRLLRIGAMRLSMAVELCTCLTRHYYRHPEYVPPLLCAAVLSHRLPIVNPLDPVYLASSPLPQRLLKRSSLLLSHGVFPVALRRNG
jgi:hypothetical protein